MSYFRNSIFALALIVALFGAAPAARAQVQSDSIATLYAKIAVLQAQIAALKGVTPAPLAASSTKSVTGAEASITKATATGDKPSIAGTATSTKTLYVTVTKDGSSKSELNKTVKVSKGKWSVKGSKKLKDGSYEVAVSLKKGGDALATETLTVGKKTTKPSKDMVAPSGTFSVSLVPLLMGGTARANQAVAVSYLKVVNTSKDSATLTGVTLAQKGSAPEAAISSLTIKDDKDGSQGQAAYKASGTTVPTTSVFAPGQMKLFTIKAVLSGSAGAHFGKSLMFDVTGVAGGKGTFPIKGTTWTIGL